MFRKLTLLADSRDLSCRGGSVLWWGFDNEEVSGGDMVSNPRIQCNIRSRRTTWPKDR
jgi:hypothetical protein